ncbi:MAG: Wzz/FepE/Etk N-terminal domain-containing protein [Chloroflexi bacterium]|nr:Wzz/FepE/Etk N-terminal domain-containing protein [Chloroflexota bacterium]MCL5074367.1 Wzz/FepE/Etk N-terminal domain-containing protein [Chloroflexota bacterium]
MQFRDYWRVLSKRWWLILLVAITAFSGSVIYSKLQTPIFRSTVKLDVSPSRYDYGLTLVIENLLRQYGEQLQTDKLAETVSERLKLDLPAEVLRKKVKVSPVLENYALQIDVDDPDPNRARDIAYVWASEFIKMHQIRMAPLDPKDRIEVTIRDNPRPGELIWPKTRANAIAGALLGLLVGILLVFLLEYLDDTLKTSEDVERYVSLTTLGAIPSLRSAKVIETARDKRKSTHRPEGSEPLVRRI